MIILYGRSQGRERDIDGETNKGSAPVATYPTIVDVVEEPTSSVFILLYTYTILPVLTAPSACPSLISNSLVKVWQLEYVKNISFKKNS